MKPKEEETCLDNTKEKAQVDSDSEMMNLEKELYSLTHYADDEEELVAHMFATIKGSKLEAMMPPILKEIPLIDVQQLCLHELRGMSQRRILSIINGQEMSGSSSEDSDEDKKPTEIQNENEDSNAIEKPLEGEEDLLGGKELNELMNNMNDANLTALDILELEMRAKLIKTMLEKQEGDEEKGEEEEEEGENGLVPDIKIKEEPLTPESTHMEEDVPPPASPDTYHKSKYSRRRRKHRHRSYSSSSNNRSDSSRSSYSNRTRSRTSSRSRSSSRGSSIGYTPERKENDSDSSKSKPTKKKISKKEFEARMKKAKMNRSYRKRKESEEETGETSKDKENSNDTKETSEDPKEPSTENNVSVAEKNLDENEVEEENEVVEKTKIEEKEEGEIDSNEEDAWSRSSRSYSRSYSSDSFSSYSSSTSSRSYSRSSRRKKSKKSKKRRRRRRSRSRSLSDLPKIPNWKPKEPTVEENSNLDANKLEENIVSKDEPTKTLPCKEIRQSISFSIKKNNAAIKTPSDLNEDNVVSTSEEMNEESKPEQPFEKPLTNIDSIVHEKSLNTDSKDGKSKQNTTEVVEVSEDFYKGADQLTFSEEGECEDEGESEKPSSNDAVVESFSNGDSLDKVSNKANSKSLIREEVLEASKERKKKRKKFNFLESVKALPVEPINLDSPFEDSNDIPKEEGEEVSQLDSLPDIAEDSTQDVLEEDSRESHMEIIGTIDPAENQNKTFDEELAAGGSSWSMRWLQSEKVQKVVSNSKMLSKVRKKIQAKGKGIVKEAPKTIPKQTAIPNPAVIESKPESPKIEVKPLPKTGSNVIGSIEEYEKLFGIRVKAPTSLPQPKLQAKPTTIQAVSILDSDDDEDSEEEAIWSKIMKK